MHRSSTRNVLRWDTWAPLVLIVFAFAGEAFGDSFDHSHQQFTDILSEYVVDGNLNYAKLKREREVLDVYLKSLAVVPLRDFQGWGSNRQLAFLINLYNAETIQLVLDHYPVDSIKDIGSLLTKPWDIKCVELFGKTVTLDTVEHGMIRRNYHEPRIHFAVACAARGCPNLRNEAYRGGLLESQLDDQIRIFLRTPQINRIDPSHKILHLSPIFKWYKKDFQSGSRGVQYFLSRYYPEEYGRSLRNGDYAIQYTDYDWALNDYKK